MIDVELKRTEPVTVAYVSMHGSYDQIPQAMGRVYGWAAQHGLQPAGMPMAVYYTAPGEVPEDEASWEVDAPLAGSPAETPVDDQGCGVKHLDPQTVATTMYRGPYEGIAPAYKELGEWVTANGYHMAGPPAEVYYSDPTDTAPEDYLTEIRFSVSR